MQTTGMNWAAIGPVALGLLFFGTIYALLIHWLAKRGQLNTYTFIFVILGTLVTVASSSPLIGLENTIAELICFAAAGLPMSIESMVRNEQDRKADLEASLKAAKDALRDGHQE